jgi:ABC-type nitrate/sulfonate/bicarbonate transport system substrate-binding protein
VPKALDAFSSSPLSTSKAFVKKAPAEARGVFDALAEALTIIHSDKATALDVAKKMFASADTKVLEGALARMDASYSKNGRFSRGNIDRTQEISVDLKIMPQILPYEDVVAPFAQDGSK